jgi:hypothetical protein
VGHTNLVYTGVVKNITFSADEALIEEAREKARKQHTTLNVVFREWLAEYSGRQDRSKQFRDLMKKLDYVQPGRKFSRDEANSRG